MTTEELIELALFDAYGLLDDTERDAFERALRTAPSGLQAHVRREQRRLAASVDLLPDVEPPADLRARVLAAVRQAEADLFRSRTTDPAPLPGHEAAALRLRPSRRVSPAWRVGALGAAAAALVFGITTLQMRSQYEQLERDIVSGLFVGEYISLVPELRRFAFAPETTKVALRAVGGESAIQAVGFIDATRDRAVVAWESLPPVPGGSYALVLVDEEDRVLSELRTFESNGHADAVEFEFTPVSGARLAIMAPPSSPGERYGRMLLVSDVLSA